MIKVPSNESIMPEGNPRTKDGKTLFYLSGPMTGLPDHNYPLFAYVEQVMTQYGLHVLSPHHLGTTFTVEQHKKLGWAFFMKQALRDLLTCDAIVLLPGWEKSKGARHELDIALDLELKVYLWMPDSTLLQISGFPNG